MVADFFEMDGWDTHYLGANMPPTSVVATARDWQADVLAISATMTFHISAVVDLIEKSRAVIPHVKLLVGGYPFNLDPDLWRRVGADGSAHDAEAAVAVANRLLAGASAGDPIA